MDNLVTEKIRNREIDETARILTGAFKTNPAYSIIFKKEKRLQEGLLWLFKANLLILNQKHPLTHVVKKKSTGEIMGTFTVVPPQGAEESLSAYLKIGIPRFVSEFGIRPLVRMLSLDAYNKKLLTASIKAPRYYYLHMVAIREEYRGSGIGTFILKSAIQGLIASKPDCKLLGLTTQLPENAVFYSRLGFDRLDEGYACFKGDRYYNCNMRLEL